MLLLFKFTEYVIFLAKVIRNIMTVFYLLEA